MLNVHESEVSVDHLLVNCEILRDVECAFLVFGASLGYTGGILDAAQKGSIRLERTQE